jgi:hypothetical protein
MKFACLPLSLTTGFCVILALFEKKQAEGDFKLSLKKFVEQEITNMKFTIQAHK